MVHLLLMKDIIIYIGPILNKSVCVIIGLPVFLDLINLIFLI